MKPSDTTSFNFSDQQKKLDDRNRLVTLSPVPSITGIHETFTDRVASPFADHTAFSLSFQPILTNSPKPSKPAPPTTKAKLLLRIQKYYASSACIALSLSDILKRYHQDHHYELENDCQRLGDFKVQPGHANRDYSIVERFFISEGLKLIKLDSVGGEGVETFVVDAKMREEIDVENCLPPKGMKRRKRSDLSSNGDQTFTPPNTHSNIAKGVPLRPSPLGRRMFANPGGLAGITARTQFISVKEETDSVSKVRRRLLHVLPDSSLIVLSSLLRLYEEIYAESAQKTLGGDVDLDATTLLHVIDPRSLHFMRNSTQVVCVSREGGMWDDGNSESFGDVAMQGSDSFMSEDGAEPANNNVGMFDFGHAMKRHKFNLNTSF
ncbi:hypothetical protein HK098_004616 [Nowakowskiella sp. JEL0407]|nr:hypothetical protein HK098_004616 [Nowakowskiella sp. JEL0407]